jgi:hypothetical protein
MMRHSISLCCDWWNSHALVSTTMPARSQLPNTPPPCPLAGFSLAIGLDKSASAAVSSGAIRDILPISRLSGIDDRVIGDRASPVLAARQDRSGLQARVSPKRQAGRRHRPCFDLARDNIPESRTMHEPPFAVIGIRGPERKSAGSCPRDRPQARVLQQALRFWGNSRVIRELANRWRTFLAFFSSGCQRFY